MLYRNRTRVAIEGGLNDWTESEVDKAGLNLWKDSSGLPDVVVATTEAFKKPSNLLLECIKEKVPFCTEDWLHAYKRGGSPSYKRGSWCFKPRITWISEDGNESMGNDSTDDCSTDEEGKDLSYWMKDAQNLLRESSIEVNGTVISYRYFVRRMVGYRWRVIGFVPEDGRHALLVIHLPKDKKVGNARVDGRLSRGLESALTTANFPLITRSGSYELPDKMDDIVIIALGSDWGKDEWVVCTWDESTSERDGYGNPDVPFKYVTANTLYHKYNRIEVSIWLEKIRNTATNAFPIYQSGVNGGSRAFKIAMKRLE